MNTNNKTYWFIGGGIALVLLYMIARSKGQTIRQKLIQDANDILNDNTTTNVTTSDGALNNVGNIRVSNDVTYKGEITSPSKNYKSFENLEYGYRAMIELLRAYYKVDGCSTLRQMISRYAPLGDGTNNPDSYTQYVSDQTGINPDADMGVIIYSHQIEDVIKAMSDIEQGEGFTAQLSNNTLSNAYSMA